MSKSNNNKKKTCQIKAANMISFNQHRKKWQRGCPCNLLINIFDKVSHCLITKVWSETKKICEVKEEKKSVNEKKCQKFGTSKKVFWLIFYPSHNNLTGKTMINEVKENLWTKKDLWTEKKLWKQRSNLWKTDRVKNFIIPKKEVFWLFFSLFPLLFGRENTVLTTSEATHDLRTAAAKSAS